MSSDMDNLTFQLECCGTANAAESDEEEVTNQDDLIAEAEKIKENESGPQTEEVRTELFL